MKFYTWNISEEKLPPARKGVYILFLNSEIAKLYKRDSKGVLYIGASSKLNLRLKVGKHKNWDKYYEKERDSLMFNHSALTYSVDIDHESILRPHKASIDNGILKKSDRLHIKYITGSSLPLALVESG